MPGPGWLSRQFEQIAEESKTWPYWMRPEGNMASHTVYVCDGCGSEQKDKKHTRPIPYPKGKVDLCQPCVDRAIARALAGEVVVVKAFCDECKGKGRVVVSRTPDPAGGPSDKEYEPCPKCQ